MKEALYGFRSIVGKEFLHILRDPTTLVFALFLPILQLILFGFALDSSDQAFLFLRNVVPDLLLNLRW